MAALALLWALWPRESGSAEATSDSTSLRSEDRAKLVAPLVDGARANTTSTPAEKFSGETIEVHVTLEGAPVKDAALTASKQRLSSSSWRPVWEPSLNQRTDEQGVAVFPASTGTWVISVTKEGLATEVVDVPKPSGEMITVVRVQLERGHELRGVAIDSAKSAVAPATIRAVPLGDRSTRRRSSPAGVVETSVDALGAFHFTGLAAGWWRIEGDAEGAGRAEPKLVSVPTSESITLGFRRSGFLEGVVVHADGGVAPHALVVITSAEGADSLEASEGGTFSTERMPGSYRVSARLGEFVGSADQVALVRAGGTTQARVVLSGRGGTLSGTVKRDDGTPVAGALVIASSHNDDGVCGQAPTEADGTWAIRGFPRGTYDLEAEAQGLTKATERGFFVGEGADVHIDLVLGRLGKVIGTVETASGAPLATRVTLRGRGGSAERQAQSDSAGRFSFDDVPAGALSVRAIGKEDEFNRPSNVMVKAGETTEVKLVVPESVMVDVELDRTRCAKPTEVAVTAMEGDSWQNRITRAVAPDVPRLTLKMSPGLWLFTGGGAVDESCMLGERGFKRLELKPGQERQRVQLVFGPVEAGFKVTVLEADGQPSPRAQVSGRDEKGGIWGITADDDGVADLNFPDDAVLSITASNQGRSAQLKGVRRSSGHATLKLGPASRIHLRLDGAVGVTRVEAFVDGDHFVDEMRIAGADGLLEEIPVGSITLVATSADESSMGRTRLTTVPGQAAEASIRLEPIAQVRGRAKLPAGATGWVMLTSSLGGFEGARIQPDGAFLFERVVAGEYTVKLNCKECGEIAPKSAKVAPGGNVEVVFP